MKRVRAHFVKSFKDTTVFSFDNVCGFYSFCIRNDK